mgnify:FL=1
MDKWTEAQITKMRVGGNSKWRQWCEASPEYSKNMNITDKVRAGGASGGVGRELTQSLCSTCRTLQRNTRTR